MWFARRTGGDGEGGEEDQDKGENNCSKEKTKHPVGGGFCYLESIGDVRWKGN